VLRVSIMAPTHGFKITKVSYVFCFLKIRLLETQKRWDYNRQILYARQFRRCQASPVCVWVGIPIIRITKNLVRGGGKGLLPPPSSFLLRSLARHMSWSMSSSCSLESPRRRNTRCRVDSFRMLQSASVRPSSSSMPKMGRCWSAGMPFFKFLVLDLSLHRAISMVSVDSNSRVIVLQVNVSRKICMPPHTTALWADRLLIFNFIIFFPLERQSVPQALAPRHRRAPAWGQLTRRRWRHSKIALGPWAS
jgi:hypothetical protein